MMCRDPIRRPFVLRAMHRRVAVPRRTEHCRARDVASVLAAVLTSSSAFLLQLGCRASETASVAPVQNPPLLTDVAHAPGTIEFVYVEGMSRIFFGFTAGPEIRIVWDVIMFSDDDDSPSQTDFTPPPPHVWLLGPDEPCRATVGGEPLIRVDKFLRATIISFEVRGCSTQGKWAPIALIANERTITDMTWRPVLEAAPFEGTRFEEQDDPIVEHLAGKLDAHHEQLGRGTLRVDVKHTATTPRVLEAEYGVLWAPDENACFADYTFESTIGVAGGDHIDPFPFSSEDMWLVGAIAKGDEPAFIVLRDDEVSAHVFVNGPFAVNLSPGEMIPVPTRPPDDEERVERIAPWHCGDDR
jgi:hypothetical protein